MKMTLKNRIAQSLKVRSNCNFHNCMHRNDIEVVFYASVMIGSKLWHLKLFIKNASQDSVKSTSRERIIDLIKSNPEHTVKTMASSLGLSVQTIRKQIVILKAEKRLKRIGLDNGGHWKVLDRRQLL